MTNAAYKEVNLEHSDLIEARNDFKNLRIGRFLGFGTRIRLANAFTFPKQMILDQLNDPEHTQLEVFLTLENGEVFVYLHGQGPGGGGTNPQGVAVSPGRPG